MNLKTTWPKPIKGNRKWWIIDAEGVILGRLATQVVDLLTGKYKVDFEKSVDMGDCVVVINGEKTTGVTTFFINQEIDTGEILARCMIEMRPYTRGQRLRGREDEEHAQADQAEDPARREQVTCAPGLNTAYLGLNCQAPPLLNTAVASTRLGMRRPSSATSASAVRPSIQLKRGIAAPAAALYQAFTNATALTGWLCDTATVQPRPGGRSAGGTAGGSRRRA